MKWLRKQFDTCFTVLQVWVDGFTILLSWMVAYALMDVMVPDSTVPGVYSQLVVVITGITLVHFWLFGMYKWRKSILNVEEYRNAFKATMISLLVTSTFIFFFRAAADVTDDAHWALQLLKRVHQTVDLTGTEKYSRIMVLLVFLTIFLLTVLQRSIFFHLASILHSKGFGNTNVAVYGTGPLALRVQQKMRLFPTLGYNFVGFLDDDPELHGKTLRGYAILGGKSQLPELIARFNIKRILVASPELEEDELVAFCRACDDVGISYQVVPRLYHFFSQRFSIDKLDSIPLITLNDKRGQPVYLLVKRVIDILIATLVLLLAAPLTLILALLIKRESPGPIFFTQIRVGQNGRTLRIIKFRTMYADMCGDEVSPSSLDDPRITKIGRFLRSTSLDELPQFWNVLRGDMSLVGPRPEMPFIVETYSPIDRLRLEAKPGITGLWQVSEARKAPIHENLDYDLYYIENQSTFLDTVIMLMTMMAVFRRGHAA